MKVLSNQKKFWETVKPIFSEKAVSEKVTSLVEKGAVLTDNMGIAEVFNDYFVNITKSLDIPAIPKSNSSGAGDIIDTIIDRYKSHPSITAIRNTFLCDDQCFNFQQADTDRIRSYVSNLKSGKATPQGDIPVTILHDNIDLFENVLCTTYNSGCTSGVFPHTLKSADVAALFKKDDRFRKENYRPISKLPNFSKVFERAMFDDISSYMSSKLSPFLSGFRAKYSTQHALLSMIEKWYR